jgi:glycosyltransferase involved in cell wall biosynthesis
MRVAVVVPWYFANGGAEKVDGVLGEMFPQADFYALFFKDQGIPAKLVGRKIHGSYLQRIPMIEKIYRPLLFTYPYAVESLDLRGYDLVITSDWACVKGVITDPATRHICYCHSPMRHVWDLYRTYLEDLSAWQRPFYAMTARRLRQYDFEASQRVESYIANSKYIADRIRHYYRRDSTVIYPPVETRDGYISETVGDYYLSVGRLNRTKRIDLLIEACNRLQRRLVVSGWGPEEQSLKALAGPTIEFVGRVPDLQLRDLYANCRALLFAANEDFGIVPVEAQSYGRPVIAFGYGGSLETVRVNHPEGLPDTGIYFADQTAGAVVDAICRFEDIESEFLPQQIREHACEFDTSVFVSAMRRYIDDVLRTPKQSMELRS